MKSLFLGWSIPISLHEWPMYLTDVLNQGQVYELISHIIIPSNLHPFINLGQPFSPFVKLLVQSNKTRHKKPLELRVSE